MSAHAGVDLGASSGRVVVGSVAPHDLRLAEVARFSNEPVWTPRALTWDVARLSDEIRAGLAAAGRRESFASVGIDTWAVDFGLLGDDGRLSGPVVHYRDPRTEGVAERFDAVVPRQVLYERNGLQHLPFTTLYQLLAARTAGDLDGARRLLLVPDLLSAGLCGVEVTELTNASTTGLLDARTRTWAPELLAAAEVDPALLAPLVEPGTVLGPFTAAAAEATGLPRDVVVTAVGSHDTASAVAGTPLDPARAAYVACGTWALVGVELERPVLTEQSRLAGFTNEGGVDERVRYLHNVMGLWVLQEAQREWRAAGVDADLPRLLAVAAAQPPGGPVVDIDDPSLLAPGPMTPRLSVLCQRAGVPAPARAGGWVRCILDSLAAAFAATVAVAARLSGVDIEVVHMVGGGAQGELLCQLTADACGLPVVAGPVEATAFGNVLVQARAAGTLRGDLDVLRDLVRRTQPLRTYRPRLAAAR